MPPGTRFYPRYAATDENQQLQNRYGATLFAAQAGWIARHAAACDIPFVVHLGEVADQRGEPSQRRVADDAMQRRENAGAQYTSRR